MTVALASALALVVLVVAVVRVRTARMRAVPGWVSLGSVSEQWVAEHRASADGRTGRDGS